MEAADVLLHHARLGDARTNDARSGHQVDVIVAAQLGEQAAHGRRLDVKTAQGTARFEHGPDVGVVLNGVEILQIDGHALVAAYEVDGGFEVPQSPLTQHVVLMQAQVFGVVHVDVGDGEALGQQPLGGVVIDGFFR